MVKVKTMAEVNAEARAHLRELRKERREHAEAQLAIPCADCGAFEKRKSVVRFSVVDGRKLCPRCHIDMVDTRAGYQLTPAGKRHERKRQAYAAARAARANQPSPANAD